MSTYGSIGVVIVTAIIYCLPTLIARQRNAPNIASIAAIDLLAGWTIIGWIIALAMALRDVPAHRVRQFKPIPPYAGPRKPFTK